MRGIWNEQNADFIGCRFNPAYAGNIIIITLISHPFQVQPRVCGEYLRWTSYLTWRKGSTPRMRGIFDKSLLSLSCVGFNPAYAGNMILLEKRATTSQVQPRVCGDYQSPPTERRHRTGSTPRMRGIFSRSSISRHSFRFNPAYAGNIARTTS